MKKYLVSELFGSLMSEDLEFEAKDMKDVKKQYLEHRNIKGKLVYDSILNAVQENLGTICIQEGHFEGNTKWIRGKRYFYKIVK